MVLGKLPVPGRPAGLDSGGARAYALAMGADGGCLDVFSLSERRPDIDWNTVSRAIRPKTTNQVCLFNYFSYNTKRSAGVCKAKIAWRQRK